MGRAQKIPGPGVRHPSQLTESTALLQRVLTEAVSLAVSVQEGESGALGKRRSQVGVSFSHGRFYRWTDRAVFRTARFLGLHPAGAIHLCVGGEGGGTWTPGTGDVEIHRQRGRSLSAVCS